MTVSGGEEKRPIGVFGGTFDPIHVGHLLVAEEARFQLELERVLFLPNREPPHKPDQEVAPFQDRREMVALAIASNPGFSLDSTEIDRPGPSYALETLRLLRKQVGDRRMVFILGFDALRELETWHRPDELLEEFTLATMDRPETGLMSEDAWIPLECRFPGIRDRVQTVRVPQIDISSEDIRDRLARGRPIRYHVPQEVEAYIRSHGLYGAASS